MALFDNENVRLDILKERAYNYRWAEVPPGTIPLTAADPDYPAAPEIARAMEEYIRGGYFSYTPKMGFPSFRKSIARALKERKGEEIDPELILPLDSAARAMYVAAAACLEPGDEMIVFDPVDYLFRESCLAAGGRTVLFPARVRDGHIDLTGLEECITPRTRMLGLCNPHNPLGVLYTVEDMERIMALCEKYDLTIMNDEIWSDIVYPEKPFVSIYALGSERCRRVLSVFGFSKSFGIAGLRVGCLYATDPVRFTKAVEKSAVMTTAGGIASICQVAGQACVDECYYWVDAFLEHLKANRDYGYRRLCEMPMLKPALPQATYMFYVDITQTGMTGEAFTDFLKDRVQLAIVPGGEKFFGSGSEGHVRICFATSRAILEEGLNRLERGVRLLAEEKKA
ncbi:MAG: pyridoxal phosphate-dependent aminotransferase [Clostridia bacterium]|nr:pyridoxal phosphate-dependent aminotransferase [Clostridia bacterium]